MARKVIKHNKNSFMSLKDFLLLGRVDNHSIIDEYNTGPGWIDLYEKAKKQFKIYGSSPPIGSHVITMRSDLGGPCGSIKKITGIETYGDKEYFILDRGEYSQENVSYLVDKMIWWAYFSIIPESENAKEPVSIL